MRVSIVAFAALRELLADAQPTIEVPDGASAGDVWKALERAHPQLAAHAASTRLARNGRLAEAGDALRDGDELALLPPVGGG